MDNAELWMDIPHYDGLYQISNYGRVWSVRSQKVLKPINGDHGYLVVNLYNKYGKQKTEKIHRLVALCFVDNPNNFGCVNHIDENKLNNHYKNLEWCTLSYNTWYSQHGEKNRFYGKTHTQDTKDKISQSRKGKKLTEEHKQKISQGVKKYYDTGKH